MVSHEFPDVARADRDLPQGAGRRGRPAGGLPHPRHRRRQGAALLAPRRRRRIRRWAGAPSASRLDRPAHAAPAAARHDARGGGPHALASCSRWSTEVDRVRCRARACWTSSCSAQAERGKPLPSAVKVGAMLEVPALLWQLPELLEAGRFPLGRQQRSAAIPVRSDRGNPAAAGALRHAGAGHEAGPGRGGARGQRGGQAVRPVRRDGGRSRWRPWRCCASAIVPCPWRRPGFCPCGPRSEAWISTAYMVTGRPSNSSTDRL